MYIGADFLIDEDLNLYLSEVNIGLPAGAFEYDLLYLEKFGKPSEIFKKIEALSRRNFSKNFTEYIRNLPYFNDLRRLKIWMDSHGPLPSNPSKELKLEDKWIQYNLLSSRYKMVPTLIYNSEDIHNFENIFPESNNLIIKRRIGRGGKDFRILKNDKKPNNLPFPEDFYIIQPYIKSHLGKYRLSIRAAAFCGKFICMFASLSKRLTSNHGYRFYINAGNKLDISNRHFKIKKVIKKAWEAEIFFGDKIPSYLYKNIFIEKISTNAELILPSGIYNKISDVSSSISDLYQKLDFNKLPASYIEDHLKNR